MKKYTLPVLVVTASFAVCISSALAADPMLAKLEQEVVLAKQKHEAINAKMDSVQMVLNEERAKTLQIEADRLIQDLMLKNVSGSDAGRTPYPEKVSDKKTRPVKIEKKQSGFLLWKPPVDEHLVLYKVAVSDKKITLEEARQIGLAHSLAIRAAKKKIEAAQAKLFEAKRAMFPTLQGVADENSGLASDVPGADTHGRLYKGRSYKINVTQPLFYGGELVLTVKQAEENLKSSKAEYEKTKGEFLLSVDTAYYGLLKAEYNAQYQRELYEKARTVRGQVKKQRDQKLISEIDFLNVESQFHQAYFQVESAQNDLISAGLIFRQTMGIESDEDVPVDLRLVFRKVDADFDEVLAIGLRQNPEVRIREHAYIAAQHGVKVYMAKKLPRVDLRGSFGILGEVFKDTAALEDDNHDLDLEKEWFLGVQGSMPVGPHSIEVDQVKNVFGPTVLALTGTESQRTKYTFNFMDRLAEATDEKSAQAALLQAESDLEKARNDLTVKLRDDFYTLQKSLIQIDAAIAKTRYQEKQSAVLEYMLGLQEATAGDYLENLVEQAQDKFSFIQAVADYNLALTNLGISIGDPTYFDRQSKTETV